jgi:hypothetical protein
MLGTILNGPRDSSIPTRIFTVDRPARRFLPLLIDLVWNLTAT